MKPHVQVIWLSLTCHSIYPVDTPSDADVDFNARIGRINTLLSLLPDDEIFGYPDKRKSLFRFGKRASPFRFGKRGSILRFGKRPSSMYDLNDYDMSDFVPSELNTLNDGNMDFASKRSSLFRFGKREEKRPHTPWRFGREELYDDIANTQ